MKNRSNVLLIKRAPSANVEETMETLQDGSPILLSVPFEIVRVCVDLSKEQYAREIDWRTRRHRHDS